MKKSDWGMGNSRGRELEERREAAGRRYPTGKEKRTNRNRRRTSTSGFNTLNIQNKTSVPCHKRFLSEF